MIQSILTGKTDDEFPYQNQYGKWWDVTYALVQVSNHRNEHSSEVSPTTHLFRRNSPQSCGDGELFHARLKASEARKCLVPEIATEARRMADSGRVMPARNVTVIESGDSPWGYSQSSGWRWCFYNFGNAIASFGFWSSSYLRVTYTTDLWIDSRNYLHSRSAWKDVNLHRTDYGEHPASYWWELTKTEIFPLLRDRQDYCLSAIFGYVPTAGGAKLSDFSFSQGLSELYSSVVDLGYVSSHNDARYLSTAYVNAFTHVPSSSSNTIANLLDVVSALRDLRKGKLGRITTVGDAWLNYRYVYNTSKSDLADYQALTLRLSRLVASCSDTIKTYGSVTNGTRVYKCVIEYRISDILPSSTSSWLQRYGVKLSLYNVWDIIPYSFVVDWFTHIGDFLESFENYGAAVRLQPVSVWYTIYDYLRVDHGHGDVFIRLRGSGIPSALPYYSYKETSTRTLLMRVTDALSLFCE